MASVVLDRGRITGVYPGQALAGPGREIDGRLRGSRSTWPRSATTSGRSCAFTGPRGSAIIGVTKGVCGEPAVARTFLRNGVKVLGDSASPTWSACARRASRPHRSPRLPALEDAERVVALADLSLNSELGRHPPPRGGATKAGRVHGVILMVELGDLREGIMPSDWRASPARSCAGGVGWRGSGRTWPASAGSSLTSEHGGAGRVGRGAGAPLRRRARVRFVRVLDRLFLAQGRAAGGSINNVRLGDSFLLGGGTSRRRASRAWPMTPSPSWRRHRVQGQALGPLGGDRSGCLRQHTAL